MLNPVQAMIFRVQQNHTVLLLQFVLIAASMTSATNPGLKARVSRTGLQYAADVATNVLKEHINHIRLPTFHGHKNLPIGKINYQVSSVVVTSFEAPTVTISTHPLQWSIKGKASRKQNEQRTHFSIVSAACEHDVRIHKNPAVLIAHGTCRSS